MAVEPKIMGKRSICSERAGNLQRFTSEQHEVLDGHILVFSELVSGHDTQIISVAVGGQRCEQVDFIVFFGIEDDFGAEVAVNLRFFDNCFRYVDQTPERSNGLFVFDRLPTDRND